MTTAIIIVLSTLSLAGLIFLVIWLTKPVEKVLLKTTHGINFELSAKTKHLTKDQVEGWIEDTIEFWHGAKDLDKDLVRKSIDGLYITLIDKIFLNVTWEGYTIKVNGVGFPSSKEIMIATMPKASVNKNSIEDRVCSLVRHEISHFIVGGLLNLWTNEEAHKLFKEVGVS